VQLLLAAVILTPPVLLVVGAVRGRVQLRACCPAPESDVRMAGAYADGAPQQRGSEVTSPRARD
jgi:hypothetical protein